MCLRSEKRKYIQLRGENVQSKWYVKFSMFYV